MSTESPALLWVRQDLRLEDNPALIAASSHPLLVVYIWDEKDPWAPGAASRWWLDKSLKSLQKSLFSHGIKFILRRGQPLEILKKIIEETKASALYWNRCYEPYAIQRDKDIKEALKTVGIPCYSFNGSLLVEPWDLQTKEQHPYRIFTPFWRALQNLSFVDPLPLPEIKGWEGTVFTESLDDWKFHPQTWGQDFEKEWTPGEAGALAQRETFLKTGLKDYSLKRDYPAEKGTSRLSPHLHWGEISPRQVWHQALRIHGEDALPYLRQLGWREFSTHLLYHYPTLPEKPLRVAFEHFPWHENTEALKMWQQGLTGYPLIDAGMRELWRTGWMHNRVRMIVASFLVKDLLLPWQLGEAWFWNTLVDADLSNNTLGWQWVSGCGADATPYFRVFNPVIQSKKFDTEGKYIKRWVPELKDLDSAYIHAPWLAPASALRAANVSLGENYPYPLVDHGKARKRALEAYQISRGV